ncbi:MAG: stealth family protein [Eubacteriales bacterium]|nr:stealth family protein [Eubacteriales bacterium]MDY3332940.1 stealth family protein [Gallibacter sp.]
MEYPIDIVIPWVDGNDPNWKAERNLFTAQKSADDNDCRYRTWDTFKYWFRSIEKNAPWVRKIHFLTWGHIPQWLNTNNSKLNIVNHSDFIPKEYLPTFSSHVIELNLHNIPDLSEHFIYFNDDVYLNKNTKPEDFFVDGIPKDSAILGVIKNNDTENFMPYIMLNMMAIINMKFKKNSIIKTNISKWLNPKYGKYFLNNLYLLPFGCFTGFRNFHSTTSFCKQTIIDVWNEIPDILHEVCTHKFRDKADINQYLFRYWQIVTGNFIPEKPSSKYFTIGKVNHDKLRKIILNQTCKVICINDDPGDFDFSEEETFINSLFEKKYNNKSSFEL